MSIGKVFKDIGHGLEKTGEVVGEVAVAGAVVAADARPPIPEVVVERPPVVLVEHPPAVIVEHPEPIHIAPHVHASAERDAREVEEKLKDSAEAVGKGAETVGKDALDVALLPVEIVDMAKE